MKTLVPIPIKNSKLLQKLQHILNTKSPDMRNLALVIADLRNDQHIEYGWSMLKQARLDPLVWIGLQAQLKLIAEQLRIKHAMQQRGNPDSTLLWLKFEVTTPAYAKNYTTIQHLLSRMLMDAGLPVTMGLEKTPKPALQLACHLPLFTEGHNEWADVVLSHSIATPLSDLPALINLYAPQGLCILEVIQAQNHASSIADLCHKAHWQWAYKSNQIDQIDQIDQKITAFLKSKCFKIEKVSKTSEVRSTIQVDVRPFFEQCLWDGQSFKFQTLITAGQATNPNKILANILGITTRIGRLARTKLEFRDDTRLLSADKFDIKIHNMYEDAIVLSTDRKAIRNEWPIH